MQDMGFSEDTIMYRAYYGFKLALPLYPFLTMYQFMQLMQSPARKELSEIALIRGGMRVGMLTWLPIAVGSAAFYGLEFGLRPVMHSVLGLQPLVVPPVAAAEADATAPVDVQGDVGLPPQAQDVRWSDGSVHTPQVAALDGFTMPDLRGGEVGGKPAQADPELEVQRYYPPLLATQIAAGTLAASAVSVNMLRKSGLGGVARFGLFCLMGGVAGTMVPSYEDSAARK
ncbi:unnamed protein product [Symbiodinium sp. KB8]|nr:unnamed protein product [Symbiodinium sp. KB8]